MLADDTHKRILKGRDAERLTRLLKSGEYESAEAAVGEALAELEASALPIEDWL
jgi:Arc/MetJ-type ribon-helix-helix transcriptional regulator